MSNSARGVFLFFFVSLIGDRWGDPPVAATAWRETCRGRGAGAVLGDGVCGCVQAAKILVAVFDDLMRCGRLTRSASLCLREVLLVLQRFQGGGGGLLGAQAGCGCCCRWKRWRRGCGSCSMTSPRCSIFFPVPELGLADDVVDILALASRQCRRSSPAPAAENELKAGVLALIREVEREIVPERERLEGHPPGATPRPVDSKVDLDDDDDDAEPPAPPPDFRCPISLDLMRDPVVSASGQTYDRESITRWFGSGKSTCPKTGQIRQLARSGNDTRAFFRGGRPPVPLLVPLLLSDDTATQLNAVTALLNSPSLAPTRSA
ncbi:hypothetical protein GUJ93_ZPchr0001g33134 [Zizania palustris]|uniref:U-box domain-containing protein n=1 Tax=Zizania palustris TaxID=103762 RepID=A0A8J5VLB8_ZIZPA|nr:hypothetical protein GUJ93_ZPchr0001g33134 [Zizania palustris]